MALLVNGFTVATKNLSCAHILLRHLHTASQVEQLGRNRVPKEMESRWPGFPSNAKRIARLYPSTRGDLSLGFVQLEQILFSGMAA